MANILEKYGIKEVADVTFYKLDDDGVPMYPVLYLDTLKVSTIEQTAETTDARGGKGNAKLITWDYNKEITVTLEDALFSAKSLAIMFGNGVVGSVTATTTDTNNYIMRTEVFKTNSNTATVNQTTEASNISAAVGAGWNSQYTAPNGKIYDKCNPKFYKVDEATVARPTTGGTAIGVSTLNSNTEYFCTYDLKITGSIIDISANSFPGTYYVTGDTFARSNNSGDDQFFQFIIPKAKVTSENTITLEAEGDPSVFNMNLTVLKPASGPMMRLVQYNLEGGINSTTEGFEDLTHNHKLAGSAAG